MKKISSLLLGCLVVAFVVLLTPYDSAKAGDISGTEEHAEYLVSQRDGDAYWLHALDKQYDLVSFRPGDTITYGEFAQWLYYAINRDEAKYPTKKKAINWLREVFFQVALQYPDYADEMLGGFTDGKYAKFSYKKTASWDWLRSVMYVIIIYQNKNYGQKILDQIGFNFDITVVDLCYLGTDEKGNTKSIQEYYHTRWLRSYAKKGAKKPTRIEALNCLYDYSVSMIIRH